MNPLHWTREHQIAWAVVSVFGAVLGLLTGFIHSPFFSLQRSWQPFALWLSGPEAHWPWPVCGFLVTGFTFYVAQLFRSSN